MTIPPQHCISTGIKSLLLLLTIIHLVILDPSYGTTYISINYEIVIIYVVSALTILYVVISVISYFLIGRQKGDEENSVSTNLALTEVVLCAAGMIGWLIITGISGNISQRTTVDTGDRFGWLAACAGINVGCFLAIAVLFVLVIINKKILERRPHYDRGNAETDGY